MSWTLIMTRNIHSELFEADTVGWERSILWEAMFHLLYILLRK